LLPLACLLIELRRDQVPCKTEISELKESFAANEDVFRLNIAMDDLAAVHEDKPIHDLLHQVLQLGFAERDLVFAHYAI